MQEERFGDGQAMHGENMMAKDAVFYRARDKFRRRRRKRHADLHLARAADSASLESTPGTCLETTPGPDSGRRASARLEVGSRFISQFNIFGFRIRP